MKNRIMGIIAKVMSSTAALALVIAIANSNSTCLFWSYQPDVPECLQ